MSATAQALGAPSVITSNPYFWSPATNASRRRLAESWHNKQVSDWLTGMGFTKEGSHYILTYDDGKRSHTVAVYFSYQESCSHCYRTFTISEDGECATIRAIAKAIAYRNGTTKAKRSLRRLDKLTPLRIDGVSCELE
jgi:hypothetical protein